MLTEKQKERRKNYIGASDMAAIMGLDPFRTAYDIWLQKTGRITETAENKAMQRGTYLEDAVLTWFADTTNKKIIRNQTRVCPESRVPIAANLDAFVPDEKRPVEAKTAGPYSKERWGEDGTDQVPDRILVQTTVQMLCTQADCCYVPAYLPYREFVLFVVKYNKLLAELILEKAEQFWTKYVQPDTPPENSAPSIDLAKNIRRQPNRTVSIPSAVCRAYQYAYDAYKEKEKDLERAKAILLSCLDGADEGICEEEKIIFVNRQIERETIDTKALKEENPDLAEKYIRKITYSTLKINPLKST